MHVNDELIMIIRGSDDRIGLWSTGRLAGGSDLMRRFPEVKRAEGL